MGILPSSARQNISSLHIRLTTTTGHNKDLRLNVMTSV